MYHSIPNTQKGLLFSADPYFLSFFLVVPSVIVFLPHQAPCLRSLASSSTELIHKCFHAHLNVSALHKKIFSGFFAFVRSVFFVRFNDFSDLFSDFFDLVIECCFREGKTWHQPVMLSRKFAQRHPFSIFIIVSISFDFIHRHQIHHPVIF